MEKYLISLLEENSRVIVPDLGAFIIRQNEPKDLVFNDLLAFDDGMLTDKLMLEEQILKAEAQSRIKQFVEKARRTLETGEAYPIENLGFLRMDASSRIEFIGKDMAPDTGKKETGTSNNATKDEDKEKDVNVDEAETPESDTPKDANQSDYEAEYLKLMSGGKKTKNKKPKIVVPEPEPEPEPEPDSEAEPEPEPEVEQEKEIEQEPVTEPEPEPEPELVVEPEPEQESEPEPVVEIEQETESKPEEEAEPKAKEAEIVDDEPEAVSEEGFVLAEGDEDVEVDATMEDTPLKADNEESRFQIEEEGEKTEIEKDKDSFAGVIAETETNEDIEEEKLPELKEEPELNPESESGVDNEVGTEVTAKTEADAENEPETEPETEPVVEVEEESVSETSAVDQARASEEARAIAEERAAMLAARQKESIKEKPISTYSGTENKKRKAWPWILGTAAMIIIVLAIAWFVFPEKVKNVVNKDNAAITMGEQSTIHDSESGVLEEQDKEAKTDTEKKEESVVETAKNQSAAQEEPTSLREETAVQQPKTTPHPEPIARPAGKQFYVVAGSFANLNNADNFVRTLKSKGFNSSVIGKRNNLYTVCFSSHASKKSAEEELARIRNSNDAQAWLLYY